MVQLFPLAASLFAAWSVQPITPPAEGGADVISSQEIAHEEEWAEEMPALISESGGLRTRVDLGCAPGQSAVRVSLEGARADSTVCFELGELCGGRLANVVRQVLRTDASGRASIQHIGALASGLGVRFTAPRAGATAFSTLPMALPSGGPLALASGQRGDVVITEIMKDPSFVTDAHGEWIEIQNITNHLVNLAGWKLTDLGSNSHMIQNGPNPIWLNPGQRFVLGIDKDPLTNGGINVDYKYSNFTLGNAADSVILTSRSGFLVDQVDYDDGILWPDEAGKSLSLHLFAGDVVLNDDPANWCSGQSLVGAGNSDLGTPALDNDVCP